MNKIEATGYDILFGLEGYDVLGAYLNEKAYTNIIILTDSNCNELCMPHFLAHLPTDVPFEIIEIEAGEAYKDLETCAGVLQSMTELGADRNSIVLTLGGGVVSDLGGFVASVYMRGIDCIYVPTSLLAMVDASVGGKTGVDLGGIKNIVGTFAMPKMVVIDTTYLETLNAREIKAGYAEMLKHGLIYDRSYFNHLQDIAQIDFSDLETLVYHSIVIKNEIVKADPKENGQRKVLNFGHTVGHAIESYFLELHPENTLLHGEAVAFGMVIEAYLSMQFAQMPIEEYENIRDTISNIYGELQLTENMVLDIVEWMRFDKKNAKGEIRMVLLPSIGEAIYDVTVSKELIVKGFGIE
ncbi:MAG: 3-dehydroquinate synthase [Flavobacteriaceae bacterium]|jgi:3-dehydroquinate synthase|nr:3-dehydroquinate synthase [Flavobacteriaceae bacterium]